MNCPFPRFLGAKYTLEKYCYREFYEKYRHDRDNLIHKMEFGRLGEPRTRLCGL